jgi:Uma2 family endonuclease
MSAMPVEETGDDRSWPLPLPMTEEWTVADLEALPDDGRRYELLDGALLVTPAPIPVHQRVIGKLFRLLAEACPPSMEVFFAPLDWQPDRRTSLEPDLLVVRNEDVGPKNITEPLVLAVEVLSPTTRRKDLLLKRSRYEDGEVSSYWIVDPDGPSLTAFDLVDGHYVASAEVDGDEQAELKLPFAVRVRPSELVVR